jgi:hypothetical protein
MKYMTVTEKNAIVFFLLDMVSLTHPKEEWKAQPYHWNMKKMIHIMNKELILLDN